MFEINVSALPITDFSLPSGHIVVYGDSTLTAVPATVLDSLGADVVKDPKVLLARLVSTDVHTRGLHLKIARLLTKTIPDMADPPCILTKNGCSYTVQPNISDLLTLTFESADPAERHLNLDETPVNMETVKALSSLSYRSNCSEIIKGFSDEVLIKIYKDAAYFLSEPLGKLAKEELLSRIPTFTWQNLLNALSVVVGTHDRQLRKLLLEEMGRFLLSHEFSESRLEQLRALQVGDLKSVLQELERLARYKKLTVLEANAKSREFLLAKKPECVRAPSLLTVAISEVETPLFLRIAMMSIFLDKKESGIFWVYIQNVFLQK